MKLKLTATFVTGALEPGDYLDTALPNFGLRVQQTGRWYFVRVREAGGRVRIKLGPAPGPGLSDAARKLTLTLAEARTKAGEQIRLHRAGARLRQPLITTAAAADTADLRPETLTVAQLAAAFLAKQGGRVWSDGWARQVKDYLERLVVPRFGHRLAASVQRAEIRDLLDTYAKQGGGVCANRLHSVICRMFRWALERDYLAVSPTVALVKPAPDAETPRSRVLEHEEIRALWRRLDTLERTAASARARVQIGIWRLRLLTGQREISLRRLQWSWIRFDEGLIEFPPPAMKRKKQPVPHLLPMSATVRALLEQRRAVAHASDLYVFSTRTGMARLPGPARGLKLELPDFQGKDLRRTAITLMRKHGGIDRETVKWVLNHKVNDVTGIYDRYDMFEEKQRALETLDTIVQAILHPDAKRDAALLRFPARAS
jgi:integrase